METQVINATEYRNVPLSLLNASRTNPRRLLAASRGNAPTVLKQAATTYKVDTDAITSKVRQEFSAKETAKRASQPRAGSAKSATSLTSTGEGAALSIPGSCQNSEEKHPLAPVRCRALWSVTQLLRMGTKLLIKLRQQHREASD